MKTLKYAIIAISFSIFAASCESFPSADQKNNGEKGKDTLKQEVKVMVIDSATGQVIDSTHKK